MNYDYFLQIVEIMVLLATLRLVHWVIFWISDIIREIIDGYEKS